MKKLVKFAIVLVVLGIFAFSSNPTITKVRNFTVEKSKVLFAKDGAANQLYDKGVEKLADSENETAKKIANVIE